MLLLLACSADPVVLRTDPDTVSTADADSTQPPRGFGTGGDGTTEEEEAEPADTASEPEPAATCDTFESAVEVGTLASGLDEVSGLAASRRQPGVLWAIEDSGNEAVLYALDIDGSVLAEVPVQAPNVDWEDLALAPCGETDCLWIADVGDNALVRDDAQLLVLEEPDVSRGGVLPSVTPRRVPVRYADGPTNVEALVVDSFGTPLLLSKEDSGETQLLAPLGDRFVSLGSVPVSGRGDTAYDSRVTAADLWNDDSELLIRTYRRAWRLTLGSAGLAGILDAPREELDVQQQAQVEAVAWDPAIRGWWQTSEGAGAGLVWTGCAGGE